MSFIPQNIYNIIISNVPIACVDVAIVYNGAVLLVKRKDAPAKNEWWVPGGRILKNETMIKAAIRKAKEEVGIICHAGPIVYTAETIFEDGHDNIPIHSINSCFLLYPQKDFSQCVLDNHHLEYKWVYTIDESLNQYVKNCLKGAGLDR